MIPKFLKTFINSSNQQSSIHLPRRFMNIPSEVKLVPYDGANPELRIPRGYFKKLLK